jgi:hypothetical protein
LYGFVGFSGAAVGPTAISRDGIFKLVFGFAGISGAAVGPSTVSWDDIVEQVFFVII